jgi:hypothetical protein
MPSYGEHKTYNLLRRNVEFLSRHGFEMFLGFGWIECFGHILLPCSTCSDIQSGLVSSGIYLFPKTHFERSQLSSTFSSRVLAFALPNDFTTLVQTTPSN